MRPLLFIVSLTIFACQQKSRPDLLVTDNLKYSAYSWRLKSDTPTFYLAQYIDIDKNGHYILMRHDTFMDTPKYFTGDISDTLAKAINYVLATDNYSIDYSIKPDDSFIYDGFTYCIDYKKKDSLAKKFQFIPNKCPEQIKLLGLSLDKLIYSLTMDRADVFPTDDYARELATFSLQTSGPLPRLEKSNFIIKE
jgi:hypothetical protein